MKLVAWFGGDAGAWLRDTVCWGALMCAVHGCADACVSCSQHSASYTV